jgi:hypothetical protein
MSNKRISYRSLGEYVDATGIKKNRVAASLGVRPQVFSYLLNPDVYRPRVTDDLVRRIAKLLNQPVDYVISVYRKAA